MTEIMYWEAIRRAHDEEMANDPMVICMGEDIGVVGGTYLSKVPVAAVNLRCLPY